MTLAQISAYLSGTPDPGQIVDDESGEYAKKISERRERWIDSWLMQR